MIVFSNEIKHNVGLWPQVLLVNEIYKIIKRENLIKDDTKIMIELADEESVLKGDEEDEGSYIIRSLKNEKELDLYSFYLFMIKAFAYIVKDINMLNNNWELNEISLDINTWLREDMFS